jgi:hypothetical protein
VLGLLLNQVCLVGNPLLLDLNDFVLKLLGLLEDVVLLGFHRSRVFIDTSILEESPLTVELIDLQLLLVDSVVPLLDVLLEFLNFDFFLLELSDQVVKLVLEQFVLLDTVQVVDSDSGDFVGQVFYFNLLLRNVLVSLFGLFQKVG